MTDVITAINLAFKDMTRLWASSTKEMNPGSRPMSYPRFKILRSVVRGNTTVLDIAEDTETDLSTTAEMLECLKDGKYVVKEPFNERAFRWRPTSYGKKESTLMTNVLNKIGERLESIMKNRLEKWL
jgi:DNA-binding MarR family transcriptional regulator